MNIRKIQPGDDAAVAEMVRIVMREFNADPKTTVLGDPTLNHMYANYQEPGTVYYVVEEDGRILGGSGIRRLDGGDESICELQRMYLLKEARGKGIGKKLMQLCLDDAKKAGYKTVYIESLSNMHEAIWLYEKTGFRRIEKALGSTGHTGCNVHMIYDL